MIVAFIESIKYIGHLVPVAFLRIFLGYFYLNRAIQMFQGDYLSHAYLAEEIRAYLPKSEAPDWYKSYLETIVIPNWQVFAYILIFSFAALGVSYIIGYLVRFMSLVGILLALFFIGSVSYASAPAQPVFLLAIHVTLGWIGAGRCLGVDYYFYKRRRGLWW